MCKEIVFGGCEEDLASSVVNYGEMDPAKLEWIRGLSPLQLEIEFVKISLSILICQRDLYADSRDVPYIIRDDIRRLRRRLRRLVGKIEN